MTEQMPEAEVSLRLAFWLIETNQAFGKVRVAIDGAQVAIDKVIHFPLRDFMQSNGWECGNITNRWQGEYRCMEHAQSIEIHSQPGVGDVAAELWDNRMLRVECKKGPLNTRAGSPEYPLLRAALGQLLTLDEVNVGDIIAVAVPKTERFETLARRWRRAPLVNRCGIYILLVSRDNRVEGLEAVG